MHTARVTVATASVSVALGLASLALVGWQHWQSGGASGAQKQHGSLKERDQIDSSLNVLEIGSDDPEDLPDIDQLCEILSDDLFDSARLPESKFGGVGYSLDEAQEEPLMKTWLLGMT